MKKVSQTSKVKIYTGCNVFTDGRFQQLPFAVCDGKIYIGESVSAFQQEQPEVVSDYNNMYVFTIIASFMGICYHKKNKKF